MRIRLLTLEQINKESPYSVGRDFQRVILRKKGKMEEIEVFDYWGCILGRWYILVKRSPYEV